LADWPAEIREPVLHQGFSWDGFRQSLREPMNLPRLFGELRDAGSAPDVPLTIVAAMGVDSVAKELVPPDAHAPLAESNLTSIASIPTLSQWPGVELRRVDDAGHSDVFWAGPDVVVEAISDMVPR
jgi:hypothetical protein